MEDAVMGIFKDEYWTHNTAYHKWILKHATGRSRVMDVGCGDGLLVQKLSYVCNEVIGVDLHKPCIKTAESRLAGAGNVSLIVTDFEKYAALHATFDLIIFVASLHHMDQAHGIEKARQLLAPGGLLLIVGCACPRSPADWCLEALRVIPAKIGSYIHGEKDDGNIGIPVSSPTLSLKEIRDICHRHLPGASIRPGLYYRYLLQWSKPNI